jgi:hypothetical protein
VNAYSSLDGGDDIVFTRLSYAAGSDTFCLWRAVFAGDDRVAGYGASMPQAAADLYQQRRACRPQRPARAQAPDEGESLF